MALRASLESQDRGWLRLGAEHEFEIHIQSGNKTSCCWFGFFLRLKDSGLLWGNLLKESS